MNAMQTLTRSPEANRLNWAAMQEIERAKAVRGEAMAESAAAHLYLRAITAEAVKGMREELAPFDQLAYTTLALSADIKNHEISPEIKAARDAVILRWRRAMAELRGDEVDL